MQEKGTERLAAGRRAGKLGMGCNLALFACKLLAGLASGSVAVIADGVNNLTDAASNVITLLGFRLAARPADEEHPFGHGRYEYLAGLTVAVLVLVAGIELLREGTRELLRPTAVEMSWTMAAVLVLSAAVKVGMMLLYWRTGRRIDSKALLVCAADSRNDALTTAAVLAGMLVSWRWNVALDGWLTVTVAAFVLWSGFSTVRDTLDLLLGKKPSAEEIAHIRETILACPGVLSTHDLLLHDYGPGRRFASVHVEMPAEGDPMVQQAALNALARDFLDRDGLHILFQVDPITRSDTEENRLRDRLAARMTVIDGRLTVHDLRLWREEGTVHVAFDCFVPADIDIPEAELRRMLTNIVQERYPESVCDVTIDRDYVSIG